MVEKHKYRIEFYHFGRGTEFSHVFESKRDYDQAKKFLDELLGSRDVPPRAPEATGPRNH